MGRIQDLLRQILSATYGRDVRQSIHDAIEQCYTDVTTGKTAAEAAATAANTAATNATNAVEDAIADATAAITPIMTAAQAAGEAATEAAEAATEAAASIQTAINTANAAAANCDRAVEAIPDIPENLSDLLPDSAHRTVTDAEKQVWNGKQNTLVSGVSIKTVNGISLLGPGNLPIQGGGGEGETELYFVNLTLEDDEWTADKTFAEVQTAYQSGKYVIFQGSMILDEYTPLFTGTGVANVPDTLVLATVIVVYEAAMIGSIIYYNDGYIEFNMRPLQDALVSGVSIKTVNGNNLLGSGNIEISGGVVSVNGQTGAVVLNANDVSAASVSALAHTNDALDLLFKLTRGQTWDIAQDNTTAYQKTIPSGTHLSVLNGWGGKSIAWNQLVHDGKVNSLTNWTVVASYATLTLDNNAIVYTRTAENPSSRSLRPVTVPDVVIGHKYYIAFDYWAESGTAVANVFMAGKYYSNELYPPTMTADSTWHTITDIVTIESAEPYGRYCDFWSWMDTGKTAKCKNIQMIDLTAMGLADVITTPEQFRAMFPADYYPYNAGETTHGDVTGIVAKRWGGKSIVWNQIVPSGKKSFTSTQADTNDIINFRWRMKESPYTAIISDEIELDFTGRYDGVFTSPVTSNTNLLHSGAVLNITLYYDLCNVIAGHKYYFSIDFLNADISTVGGLRTDNLMIVDLTAAGLADIITTPEQFRAMFPADYYPYNEGEELSPVIATHSIPAAVRALTGYGWSGGSVANTVEYDAAAKKWYYHQRAGQAKIDGTNLYFTSDGAYWNIEPRHIIQTIVSSDYINGSTLLGALGGARLSYNQANEFAFITQAVATSLGFASKDDANAKLQAAPTWFYYELATPIVTDITNLMTGFDNYLNEVEPGGAITFENSHGADYEIPVPSQIDHYRNLSEVTP